MAHHSQYLPVSTFELDANEDGLGTSKSWRSCFTLSRGMVLFLSTCCALTSGTLYGFGEISPQIATAIGRLNVDYVGSFGDLGALTGIIQGVVYDKYGARVTFLSAAACSFIGFSISFLMVHHILPPSVPLLCFAFYCLGQANHARLLTLVAVNSQNFSIHSRGVVTGYIQACFPLSVCILVPFFVHILHRHIGRYFAIVMVLAVAFDILAAVFVRLVPMMEDATVVLGEDIDSPTIYASPALIASELNLTPREMVKTSEFRLLFGLFSLVAGPGLMWKNVVGSITRDLGLAGSGTTEELVLLWATINAFSRVAIGWLSDRFASTISRALWLAMGSMVMCAGHIIFLSLGADGIMAATLGTSVGHGISISLACSITGLFFGMEHYGVNYGLITLGPAFSGIIFTFVSTSITKLQRESQGHCHGMHCFTYQFVMTSISLCVAAVLSFVLSQSSRSKKSQQISASH